MPNNSVRTFLELPPGTLPDTAQLALNDRMRTIAARLDSIAGGGSTTNISGGPSQLVLSVPGTIGIRSNAAPLVTFPVALNVSSIVALVKQAPVGADIQIQVSIGSGTLALTIAAGSTQASQSGTLGTIPVNTPVILNLVKVGTTFPGADLTVILRF